MSFAPRATRDLSLNENFRACSLSFSIQGPDSFKPFVSRITHHFKSVVMGDTAYCLQLKEDTGPGLHAIASDSSMVPHEAQDPLRLCEWTEDRAQIGLAILDNETVSAAFGYMLVGALSSRQGLLLHGALLGRGERGYLFLGKSGAGKTTIAKNASSMLCINSDKAVVRKIADRWMAHGAPMMDNGGVAGRSFTGLVGGVFLLEQSDSLYKTPIEKSEALEMLTQNVILPPGDTSIRSGVIGNLLAFVDEVPCWSLGFKKDSDISDFL